jgi:hypothetical protein
MSLTRSLGVLCIAALLSGCTHKADAAAQVKSALAPFTAGRDQAVALVAAQKQSLGAADLNTLEVLYTALEAKGNAYAGFIVEAATASSFDDGRNQRYADDLVRAIHAFNQGFAALSASKASALSDAWVAPFAASLHGKWSQYQPLVTRLSPQQNLDLIAKIKHDTVWPNFEDIATEKVH